MEYIPGTLIRKRKPEEWEALLFEAHEGVDSDHPELDYIAVCKELEYYGCALFPVKVCAAAGCRLPLASVVVSHQATAHAVFSRCLATANVRQKAAAPPDFGREPQGHFVAEARGQRGHQCHGTWIGHLQCALRPCVQWNRASPAPGAQKVIAEHSLNDIYRWAYKPGVNFYFEVKPEDEEDDNPLYMFGTVEGKHIADLLTDYAMGLLREMGLNADGTRRDGGDEDEAKFDGEGDEDADDAGDDAADGAAGAGDDDDSGLPDGWVEVPDEASGAVYFYNNETGESRWDRPT